MRGEYQRLREEIIFRYESSSYAVVQEEEKFAKTRPKTSQRPWKGQTAISDHAATAMDEFEQKKDKPGQECQRIRLRGHGGCRS